MKRTINYLALVLLVAVGISFGQTKEQLTEIQLLSLIEGIKSDNAGLIRSSIFLAGYYRIESAADEIKDEMLSSNDPKIQVLAALALYEIGNDEVLDDLYNLSQNINEDLKVRRMAKAIYDQWVNDKANFVAVTR